MANHKSAAKRARQTQVKRDRNIGKLSDMRTKVKKVRAAVTEKNADLAKTALVSATSILAKIGRQGIMHQKTTSRSISRLTKLVATIAK